MVSQSNRWGDPMKADSNPDDVAVERADLISRLRREINHAAGGTSGLDRQDELLKTWHDHVEPGDRDFSNDSNDLNGEAPSPSGDFHDTVKPGQTGDSNLDLERLPTGWISMCKDRIGSDVSSVGIDSQMGGGLLRHGIHEWIGDPYQAPQVDLSSKSDLDPADLVSDPDWVPPCGPVISLLHRLQASHDSLGRTAPRVVWIGHRCLPAPWNLLGGRRPAAFDVESCLRFQGDSKHSFQDQFEDKAAEIDGRLLEHSLFITPPRDDRQARRWCLEQAVRNISIDAVVVDGSGFAPLDSRRLHMAVSERKRRGESPLLVLMVRPPRDRFVRSSAITRWWVMPSLNESSSDRRIATWSARLLRARMPQSLASMKKPIVGLVCADWDLESVASETFPTTTATSPLNCSLESIEKDSYVDTSSFDPISLAGHRSGSPPTSSSNGEKLTPKWEGLFEEISIPEERIRRRFSQPPRHRTRMGSANSGGRNASWCSTSDRLLFNGESAGDPERDDARGSEGTRDAGDQRNSAITSDDRWREDPIHGTRARRRTDSGS